MEKRGIPSAVICTGEFATLGHTIAEFLGLPGLPMIVIKHPLGGLEKPDVMGRAEEALEQVADVFTVAGGKKAQKQQAKA